MKTYPTNFLLCCCAFIVITIFHCTINIYSAFIFKKNLSNEITCLKEKAELQTQILNKKIAETDILIEKYEKILQTYTNILEKSESQELINSISTEAAINPLFLNFLIVSGSLAFYLLIAKKTHTDIEGIITKLADNQYRQNINTYPINNSAEDQKIPNIETAINDLNNADIFNEVYGEILLFAMNLFVGNNCLALALDILFKYLFP
jgi:hypothetical protein